MAETLGGGSNAVPKGGPLPDSSSVLSADEVRKVMTAAYRADPSQSEAQVLAVVGWASDAAANACLLHMVLAGRAAVFVNADGETALKVFDDDPEPAAATAEQAG